MNIVFCHNDGIINLYKSMFLKIYKNNINKFIDMLFQLFQPIVKSFF